MSLKSDLCSLAAGYGKLFTAVHIIILSTISLCLCLPLSLPITLLDFLSQSLCLFLPLWQTCITCLSLIFIFSPSLSLFTRCCSLSLSFLIHPLCLPLTLTYLPLALSLLLCLAYFRHHPPTSCFLLCVCFLFRLTLLLPKGNESIYMSACCGRHSSASIPSGHLGGQQIYTYTSAHTHTGMPSLGYYMWLVTQCLTLL